MENFKFRYKTKYDNSFVSTLILFFLTFFIGLWLFFFGNPQLTLILFGLVIAYLIYWNFNIEGKVEIIVNDNEKEIYIKGEITENYKIEKIYFGWNYAFVNHGKAMSINPMMPVISDDKSRPTSNTNQCIALLKLKNGEHIVLIKELKPWSETRDLEYIGHLTDTLETKYNLYIKGNFWKFRKILKTK